MNNIIIVFRHLEAAANYIFIQAHGRVKKRRRSRRRLQKPENIRGFVEILNQHHIMDYAGLLYTFITFINHKIFLARADRQRNN